MPDLSIDRVYLMVRDLEKSRDALNTRVEVLEHFIRERFPEYFAGEVGTVVDLELNPVQIIYGNVATNAQAQERYNDTLKTWERYDVETGRWIAQ